MKAISLWNPWATAMSWGMKTIETRSWPTSYRGDLVICSAKRKPKHQEVLGLVAFSTTSTMLYGFALCIVELYECVPADEFHRNVPMKINPREWNWGDYSSGRFAWMTRRSRIIDPPIPVRGYQGLWNLDPEIESKIRYRWL